MPAKPRFAIYTRISKDPEGTSLAPARQEKECRRLARDKGIEVAEVFTDVDLSAWSGVKRPEYERMLAAMADGEIDGVIVWKLDRLVRQIVEFSRFWRTATDAGVKLIAKEDSIDTSTPIGLALVYLLVGLAEQESYNTSIRAQAYERQLAEAGRHKGAGRRAYGLESGWEAIVETEAAVIREAADRVLAGEAVGAIAKDLNKRGIPSAEGGCWTRTSLTTLLRQARLWGWREHKGELTAPGSWPAILDESTGRQLRSRLGARRPPSGATRERQHLLSGLLRCEKCGARMKAGRSTSGRGRYLCPPAPEGGCGRTTVDQEGADTTVAAIVLLRLASPEVAAAIRQRREKGRKVVDGGAGELLEQLAQIAERIDELGRSVAAGETPLSLAASTSKALEERAAELNERLASARASGPLGEVLAADDLDALWDALPISGRRAILDAVLERVVVHGTGSPWYREQLRTSLLEEAAEAEAAGDRALATRRRHQAASRTGGGGSFRPERLEPIWSI